MMLHGETLRAAAESVVAFNCGLIDALCDIVPAVKPQAAYYELFDIKILFMTVFKFSNNETLGK